MEEKEVNQTKEIMTNLCTCALALSRIADYVLIHEDTESPRYRDATEKIIDAQSAAMDAVEEMNILCDRLEDVEEHEVKSLKEDLSAARDTVRRNVEDFEKVRGWMYRYKDEAGRWSDYYEHLKEMAFDRLTPEEQERHKAFVKAQEQEAKNCK